MDRMTRNPATLIAGVLAFVGVGFILGVRVGGRRAVEEGRPTQTAPTGTTAASRNEPRGGSGSETGGQEEERTRLRERILELESQLRIAREESARKPPSEAEAEIARRAFEDLLSMESGDDRNPERLRSLIEDLARVSERSAAYFIARFRSATDAKDDDVRKKISMQLALMSGGPDAADFVQQLLTDPTLEAGLRERLLSELASRGDGLFSIRRLPAGESLASTAMLMIHSDKLDDRRAGANLLGGIRSSASRAELIRLLQDSDGNVRESAARSLGIVGDQTTKKILETYAAQTEDAGLRKAAAAAIREIDGQ